MRKGCILPGEYAAWHGENIYGRCEGEGIGYDMMDVRQVQDVD